MHRALQQEPSMEVRQLESGRLGVSKKVGLGQGRQWACPGHWALPRLDVSRPHCGSHGCFWTELKNDRNFPNRLFFHSQGSQPPRPQN